MNEIPDCSPSSTPCTSSRFDEVVQLAQSRGRFVKGIDSFRLSQLLCDVVLLGEKFDQSDWSKVLDLYVFQLAAVESLEFMDSRTKFAIVVTMIGSQHSVLFQHAFNIFSSWEQIKGPYWVIQEELQRHYCLCVIRSKLHALPNNNSIVERLFSTIDLATISNETLIGQLPKLREEIEVLLRKLQNEDKEDCREQMFEDYCNEYPLASFSEWFVKWALSKYEFVYKMNGARHNSVCTQTTPSSQPSNSFSLSGKVVEDAADDIDISLHTPRIMLPSTPIIKDHTEVSIDGNESSDTSQSVASQKLSVLEQIRHVICDYLDPS